MYFLLTIWLVFKSLDSALGKTGGKIGLNLSIFNLGKAASAILLPIILCLMGGVSFHLPTLIFALLYGALLSVSNYAGLNALKYGNMGIVSTIVSFSMIIPLVYGLVFLGETLSHYGIIGLFLISLSIVLLNIKKTEKGISNKCLVFIVLVTVSNGICSIIQKEHQIRFPNLYQGEFMFFSSLLVLFVFMVVGMVNKKQFDNEGEKTADKAILFGIGSGICNCIANYLILVLSATENATSIFPIQSVMSLLSSCLIGALVFKEKLTLIQWVSIFIGIVAVVLMRI